MVLSRLSVTGALILLLLVAGCAKDSSTGAGLASGTSDHGEEDSSDSSAQRTIQRELSPIVFSRSDFRKGLLTSSENALVTQMSSVEPVSSKRLHEALLQVLREYHLRQISRRQKVSNSAFITVPDVMSLDSKNPHDFKKQIEASLTLKRGYEIFYNRAARTLAKLGYDAEGVIELNCESGTFWYDLSRRSYEVFFGENLGGNHVLIYMPGHVLPGYIVNDPQGARLVGVEMTQKGSARRDFGLVNALDQPIRILSADDAMLLTIFDAKFASQKIRRAKLALALDRLAAHYGFSDRLPLLEKRVRESGAQKKPGEFSVSGASNSIAVFGSASVAPGRMDRGGTDDPVATPTPAPKPDSSPDSSNEIHGQDATDIRGSVSMGWLRQLPENPSDGDIQFCGYSPRSAQILCQSRASYLEALIGYQQYIGGAFWTPKGVIRLNPESSDDDIISVLKYNQSSWIASGLQKCVSSSGNWNCQSLILQ